MLTRSSLAVPLGDEIMIPMCRKRSRQPSTSPPGPSEPRRSAQAAGDANRPRSRAGPRVGPPRVRSGATACCGGTLWRLSPGLWLESAPGDAELDVASRLVSQTGRRGDGGRASEGLRSRCRRRVPGHSRGARVAGSWLRGQREPKSRRGDPSHPPLCPLPLSPSQQRFRRGRAKREAIGGQSSPIGWSRAPPPPRSLHRAGGDGGGRGPQGKGTRTRRAEEGRRWRGAGGGPFSKTVSALLATRAAFRSRLSWACPQSVWGGRFRLCSRRCHE